MKRFMVFLFLFCFTGITLAYAHPPSDIRISFDPAARVLKADIAHNVRNPANHYIKRVDVSLNGKDVINHFISCQSTPEGQSVLYSIPDAKSGDLIFVEGHCNISGKLQKSLRLP